MGTEIVLVSVVLARFALPLLIPLHPLPAIIGCLVLDAADQTIFQTLGYDPPHYQSYDKAMDVFYLSIAYLASLRNWTNLAAVNVSRFLFFYRQVGAVAFELSGLRWLLIVFPNTFEYFFIAYEAIRSRWNPARFGLKFWVLLAGGIWVFVKLPQEYWIHIAQLDFTDAVRDNPWFGPAVLIGLLALGAVALFVVRPRLPQVDWSWRFAADPLPAEMDEAHERAVLQVANRRVLDGAVLEKTVLIGLISVIYAEVLPGVEVDSLRLFLGIGVFVVVNAAIGIWTAKRGYSWESAARSFGFVFAINVCLIVIAQLLLADDGDAPRFGDTLFFVFLFSILTMLYDRYHPVYDYRMATAKKRAAG
jgi:hypothetical protein